MSDKKVVEITNWKQLKEQNREGFVDLEYPDGKIVRLKIKGVLQKEIDVINEKYDSMKPTLISIPEKDEKGRQIGLKKPTEGPIYEEWKKQSDAIENLRLAELVLTFLVVKPEGTFEEQIKEIKDTLLAGHYVKIINAGMMLSGFDFDKKVEQAKNF